MLISWSGLRTQLYLFGRIFVDCLLLTLLTRNIHTVHPLIGSHTQASKTTLVTFVIIFFSIAFITQ
jgi:hypothetical protein